MKGKRKVHRDQGQSAGARSKKIKLQEPSVLEQDGCNPAQDDVDATKTAENATNATGDHGIEHRVAGVKHSTTDVEHSTASKEHSTAGVEHSTASVKQSTASEEQCTAGIEHSTAAEEHSPTSEEHSTTSIEHSTSSEEQNTADEEHSTASGEHSTAGVKQSTASIEHSTADEEHITADEQRETKVVPNPDTEIHNKVDKGVQPNNEKTQSDSAIEEKKKCVVDRAKSDAAEASNIDASEYDNEAKDTKNKQQVNTDANVEEGSQESPSERKNNQPSGANWTLELVVQNLDGFVTADGNQDKESNQTTGSTDINEGSADEGPDTDQAAQETHDGLTSDEWCTFKLAESASTVNEATVNGNAVEKGYPRCDAEVLELGCQDGDDVTTVGDDITDSQLCALDWSSQWPTQTPSSAHGCLETRASDPSTEDLVAENDQLENATAVVITLVKELQNMNRSLLKTKREIEAARRQRMH